MPTRQEVAEFLSEFKSAIRLGFVTWLPRPAHRQHLVDLNITQNQALEIIQGLSPDEYSRGPEPDDMKPERAVWVFGTIVDANDVYIKLALQPDNNRRSVVHGLIWSFHKADRPLQYPLRVQKQ